MLQNDRMLSLSKRFGEKSMTRIVSWMRQSHLVTEKSKILDLGCGNGVLLIEMVFPFLFLSNGIHTVKTHNIDIRV